MRAWLVEHCGLTANQVEKVLASVACLRDAEDEPPAPMARAGKGQVAALAR